MIFYIKLNKNLNILNLDLLIEFLINNYSDCHVNLSLLDNPSFFNIEILPDHVKKIVLDRLRNLNFSISNLPTKNESIQNFRHTIIRSLQSIISMLSISKYNDYQFSLFKSNIQLYDHYRNQNIKDYIPDWVPFL